MTQQEFFARYTYKPSTDKLGGGAFGTVFKAYDETLGKYIAIKVAEQKQIGDRILSLADEFNALKNIQDHKNIAKYDVFYTFEQPTGIYDFALMQYYPDGNLSQLIKKGNLTKEQKENLALQLLNGINFLHQNQVVHRDLKPSNILIQKHDLTQEYIPKITDFGLSKKANTDKNTHFTNSFPAGTYAYSSPEQLRGEILRFNTDWWAYGAIVYEIFTGKTMFNIVKSGTGSSAMDLKAILDQILNSDINTKIKELPLAWQPVIAACVERDAQKRIKTADELLQILNKEEKTVIIPTKQTEETILEQVIPKTSPIKPKIKIPYKYIAIATLLFIVPLAIYFAIRKPTTIPAPITQDNADSIANIKMDTSRVIPEHTHTQTASLPLELKTKPITNTNTGTPSTQTVANTTNKPDPNWRKKYTFVDVFYDGVAKVGNYDAKYPNDVDRAKFGFVNRDGIEIIPLIYQGNDTHIFHQGFCRVQKNNKVGMIDKKGKVVVPIIYDYVYEYFDEDLVNVELNGKNGYVNKSGTMVIPLRNYEGAWNFAGGIALVKANGKFGYIDKSGKEILPLIYDSIEAIDDNIYAKLNGKLFIYSIKEILKIKEK